MLALKSSPGGKPEFLAYCNLCGECLGACPSGGLRYTVLGRDFPGAGRLFTALGGSNINIRMISQGSSEANISFVVRTCIRVKRTPTRISPFRCPLAYIDGMVSVHYIHCSRRQRLIRSHGQ